jgi:hypothetical protein
VIFSAAADVPEFQRQVATPNVLKFTTALIPLAEKHVDTELKVSTHFIIHAFIDVAQILALSTLALIIPLYPTLHRASHSALSALCLGFLNGNPFKPPNVALTRTASRLYMVLHFTGGKVGAANLWRKSVDDTLAFGWTSFLSVRSTFLVDGTYLHPAISQFCCSELNFRTGAAATSCHRRTPRLYSSECRQAEVLCSRPLRPVGVQPLSLLRSSESSLYLKNHYTSASASTIGAFDQIRHGASQLYNRRQGKLEKTFSFRHHLSNSRSTDISIPECVPWKRP